MKYSVILILLAVLVAVIGLVTSVSALELGGVSLPIHRETVTYPKPPVEGVSVVFVKIDPSDHREDGYYGTSRRSGVSSKDIEDYQRFWGSLDVRQRELYMEKRAGKERSADEESRTRVREYLESWTRWLMSQPKIATLSNTAGLDVWVPGNPEIGAYVVVGIDVMRNLTGINVGQGGKLALPLIEIPGMGYAMALDRPLGGGPVFLNAIVDHKGGRKDGRTLGFIASGDDVPGQFGGYVSFNWGNPANEDLSDKSTAYIAALFQGPIRPQDNPADVDLLRAKLAAERNLALQAEAQKLESYKFPQKWENGAHSTTPTPTVTPQPESASAETDESDDEYEETEDVKSSTVRISFQDKVGGKYPSIKLRTPDGVFDYTPEENGEIILVDAQPGRYELMEVSGTVRYMTVPFNDPNSKKLDDNGFIEWTLEREN